MTPTLDDVRALEAKVSAAISEAKARVDATVASMQNSVNALNAKIADLTQQLANAGLPAPDFSADTAALQKDLDDLAGILPATAPTDPTPAPTPTNSTATATTTEPASSTPAAATASAASA